MGLVWWWMILFWIVLGAVVVWVWRKQSKQHRPLPRKYHSTDVVVAHKSRVTSLPSYQKAYRLYRIALMGAGVIIGIAGLSALILSARPTTSTLVSPEQKNRDIMLCLDVSGSMYGVDKDVLATFQKLVQQFDGQRMGLIVFNSSASTVVPLTDDYQLLKDSLQRGVNGFNARADTATSFYTRGFQDQGYLDGMYITYGTDSNSDAGASLVGDGLAQCVRRMGSNEQKRSQSIILATDNEVMGTPIMTTLQAGNYAASKNIRVYTINPGSSDSLASNDSTLTMANELKQVASVSGGQAFDLANLSVATIISDISKQEATLFAAPPELAQSDIPGPFAIVLVVAIVGFIGIAWRWKL